MEARLIKDMQPKHNQRTEGRQELSLPADHHARRFSARGGHARAADQRRQTVRSVRQRRQPARGSAGDAADLQVPHVQRSTSKQTMSGGGGFGLACWRRSTNARRRAICGFRRRSTASDIQRLRMFLEGKRNEAARSRCEQEMQSAAAELQVREGGPAPRRNANARDARRARRAGDARPARGVLHRSQERAGGLAEDAQAATRRPRIIEGVDIAHLGGDETVASLVQFIDGLPFKPGYRRFRIRDVEGIDDFASIHEVVARRYQRPARRSGSAFPTSC